MECIILLRLGPPLIKQLVELTRLFSFNLCLSNIDVDVETAAENGCDNVDEHVYKTTIERRLKQRRELFDLFILNPRQFIV